jgi:hypothetical protein
MSKVHDVLAGAELFVECDRRVVAVIGLDVDDICAALGGDAAQAG